MSKIKVKISETKYHSFYKTLVPTRSIFPIFLTCSVILNKVDLKLFFFWVADFFLVPGRDKYTMWDRRPLGQILFDPNRLYDVLYVH